VRKIAQARVTFLEVGHGDSIIIEYPDGTTATVVDTADARVTYDYIVSQKIQRIEWVVLSHGDADHYRGIGALVRNLYEKGIEISKLAYIRGDKKIRSDKGYRLLREQFVEFQDNFGISTYAPYANTVPVLANNDGLEIMCLYPNNPADVDSAGDEANNWSVVLMLSYLGHKILLPGDLEGAGWFRLMKYAKSSKIDLKADVLKLPHHGSWFGEETEVLSLDKVINTIKASVSIISGGFTERFNFPSSQTIGALRSNEGVRIMCTGCGKSCHNGMDITNIPGNIILGKSTHGRKLPCAGSIQITITNSGLHISPSEDDHTIIKKQLDNPLCMQ